MTAQLSGYASLTEVPYEVGPFTETIKRGAFKRTLGEKPDVQLLINHGQGGGIALARTTNGTLQLSEDDRGLKVAAELDEQRPDVATLIRAMDRGTVDQMSFAFQATDQNWDSDYTERTIKSVNIHRGDVSVVNQGASPTTWAKLGPGSTRSERQRIAESVGRNVRGAVEFRARAVERTGTGIIEVRMEARAASTARLRRCARCGTTGKITLGGKRVPCPNCGGKGHRVTTTGPTDAPHNSTATDGSSRAASSTQRSRERIILAGGDPDARPARVDGRTNAALLRDAGAPPAARAEGRTHRWHSLSPARRLLEVRGGKAKYTAKQIAALGKQGKAFKNPDGIYSYPIDDLEDLKNAIRAVGRGGASHNAIRKYIAGRAKAMGQASLIPPSWNADGSLK